MDSVGSTLCSDRSDSDQGAWEWSSPAVAEPGLQAELWFWDRQVSGAACDEVPLKVINTHLLANVVTALKAEPRGISSYDTVMRGSVSSCCCPLAPTGHIEQTYIYFPFIFI